MSKQLEITAPGWRLVNKDGQPVCKNTVAMDFRGSPATVVGGTAPRHSGSAGRVEVRFGKTTTEYYPSVYDMTWVRAESEVTA